MSPATDEPTAALRNLGAQLKDLRARAGLDQATLASVLGVAQPQISRLENGRRLPPVPVIREWVRACAAADGSEFDAEPLIALREAAGGERVSWQRIHRNGLAADQHSLGGVEAQAQEIRVFQSSVIPGQLQTASYAQRLFELGTSKTPDEVAAGVQARLERQAILYHPPEHGCHFLISEAALRWRPTGDDGTLIAAQLDRLLALLDLPGIDIGLLPWEEPQPATHRHPFVLYRLPDDQDDMVIVETIDGENVVRDADLIALYLSWYDRLASAAWTGQRARDFLHRLLEEAQITNR